MLPDLLPASTRLRRLSLGVILFALAGCADEVSLATVSYAPTTLMPREMLSVTLSDPWRSHTIAGANVGLPGAEAVTYPTGEFGRLRMTFRLASGAAVASEGSVELHLAAHTISRFVISVAATKPPPGPVGWGDAVAFPLAAPYRQSANDSVWVRWTTELTR